MGEGLYIVTGCYTHEDALESWVVGVFRNEVEARLGMLKHIEIELYQFIENSDVDIEEFIDTYCEYTPNFRMIRFNDTDGLHYLWKIVDV